MDARVGDAVKANSPDLLGLEPLPSSPEPRPDDAQREELGNLVEVIAIPRFRLVPLELPHVPSFMEAGGPPTWKGASPAEDRDRESARVSPARYFKYLLCAKSYRGAHENGPGDQRTGESAMCAAVTEPGRDVEARVDPARPEVRFHKIRSLQVRGGGFLDDLSVSFDPNLNCVIGGRGTGKSTLLEFLRYALKAMPEGERGAAHQRHLERLVAGNLGAGRIRVGIETRDGLLYHVERGLNEEPEVFDADSRSTPLTLDHGSFFKVDVYSQNEIERVAESPSLALDLIDKFIDGDVREIEHAIRGLVRELSANGADLVRLTTRREELSEGLSEIDVIAEKLRAMQGDGGRDAAELNREIALKGLRDREKRALQAVDRHVLQTREAVAKVAGMLRPSSGFVPAEVLAGPNAAVFETAEAAFRSSMSEIAALLDSAEARLAGFSATVRTTEQTLLERHQVQEVRYREIVGRHDEQKDRANERTRLQKRGNELEERKHEAQRACEAREELRTKRVEMLRELSNLRQRRTALRQQVVRNLNENLMPYIRVTLEETKDASEYQALLTEGLKGSGIRYGRLVESIADTIAPAAFAELASTGDPEAVAARLNTTPERAICLVEQLRGTQILFDIEAVGLRDLPRIELKDGPDYKDSAALSTGQKCTSILPILLLESERPLLIDQPEDNLDNAFIYETVVRRLLEVKRNRQILFVTHNPNIPVLGDAGRVIVMNSSGRHATAASAGSVDEVKGEIERILEGGADAFEERKRRYGR